MPTAQFKKRTTHLDISWKNDELHQHVVKTCPFCTSVKPRPERSRVSGLGAEEFGDLIFLDHGSAKIGDITFGFLIILDGATSHLTAYPCKSTSTSEVIAETHGWMDTCQMNLKATCADMAFHRPHDMQAFCTYTHLLHAHVSAHCACTVTFAHFHACAHTRMAQARVVSKGVRCTCIIPLHLAFSISCMTRLCCSCTSTSTIPFRSTILPYFPVLKAQDMRHSALASKSLATWPSQMQTQVMSPTSSTRSLLWTTTQCSMKSLTSPKTHENTEQFGVPSMFESSVSHVSHDDFALQIESKESIHRETDC